MRIGEAAEQAGVNIQTLRYYERRGLLPRAPRRESGYRDVPAETVRVVRFVKRAQELGFSLEDVEDLLRLRRDRGRNRRQVRALAEKRRDQIDDKIAQLQRMRGALQHLVHACQGGGTPECPIIEALDSPAGTRP